VSSRTQSRDPLRVCPRDRRVAHVRRFAQANLLSVSAAHDVLIGGGSLALPATAPSGVTPGVTLICVDPDHDPNMPDAVRAAARSVDALMLSADDLATRKRDALQRGFEVDDEEWRSLAEYGFGVLAESTERSLRGAGA